MNDEPDFSLNRDEIAGRLAGIKAVMFDIDGCLILSDQPGGHGGRVLPGAREAVTAVRGTGREIVCFTNGSMNSPSQIAAALRRQGLDFADDEVLTPSSVAAATMSAHHPGARVLAFGGPGIIEPLLDAGVEVVDVDDAIAGRVGEVSAVIVSWDTEFGQPKIQAAAEAILAGASLFTTSDAPSFASMRRLNVGVSGFIAAGLTHVTGQPYRLLGKPSAEAIATIELRTGTPFRDILVVGDDLSLEAGMANRGGGFGVLVTTGTNSRNDAISAGPATRPSAVIDSLAELAEALSAHDPRQQLPVN